MIVITFVFGTGSHIFKTKIIVDVFYDQTLKQKLQVQINTSYSILIHLLIFYGIVFIACIQVVNPIFSTAYNGSLVSELSSHA